MKGRNAIAFACGGVPIAGRATEELVNSHAAELNFAKRIKPVLRFRAIVLVFEGSLIESFQRRSELPWQIANGVDNTHNFDSIFVRL